MERKEIEEEIAMQCIYAHYEENELFKTGALWGYDKAKQEPPSEEYIRKFVTIYVNYCESKTYLYYPNVVEYIHEHWND